jgi:hypothetical protein
MMQNLLSLLTGKDKRGSYAHEPEERGRHGAGIISDGSEEREHN